MSSSENLTVVKPDIYKKIGQYFRDMREDKGISLSYLANDLNKKYSYKIENNLLGKFERGASKMSVELCLYLCDYYKIDYGKFQYIVGINFNVDEFKSKVSALMQTKLGRDIITLLTTDGVDEKFESILLFLQSITRVKTKVDSIKPPPQSKYLKAAAKK
jgi:transcriptional regulator with XRE-family HTH domain